MTESLQSNADQSANIQSLYTIEKDIRHLHESITLLHQLTQDQQPSIDSIQDAIIHSKEQAHSAQQDLQQAEEYQTSTRYMNRLLAFTGMVVAGIVYLL